MILENITPPPNDDDEAMGEEKPNVTALKNPKKRSAESDLEESSEQPQSPKKRRC